MKPPFTRRPSYRPPPWEPGRGVYVKRPFTPTAWLPTSMFVSGVTGGVFDPSNAATCWQDAARTTPAGDGDPVGCIDNLLSGGLQLNPLADAARPLRVLESGVWRLRFDGVDDGMQSPNTLTLGPLPIFMASVIRKTAQDSKTFLSLGVNATNYVRQINVATNERVQSSIRETTLGTAVTSSPATQSPINTTIYVASRFTAGAQFVKVGDNAEATAVNSWTTESVASALMMLGQTSPGVSSAAAFDFMGGVIANGLAPSAEQLALTQAWFEAKAGL